MLVGKLRFGVFYFHFMLDGAWWGKRSTHGYMTFRPSERVKFTEVLDKIGVSGKGLGNLTKVDYFGTGEGSPGVTNN